MHKKWLLAFGLLVPLLAVASVWVWQKARPHTFSGLERPLPLTTAPDFTLLTADGQEFRLSSLQGKWVLLAYGYTTCPDICPATLAAMKRIKTLLGDQADQVEVVFVTIDPERDTPEVMGNYVAHFSPDFWGLSGTAESIALAAHAYGVTYERQEVDTPAIYQMNHSAYIYLIDPQFRWRLTFPFGVPPQEMANDVAFLMAQTEAHP